MKRSPIRSRSRKPHRVNHHNEVKAAIFAAKARDGWRCQAPGAFGLECAGLLEGHHLWPRSVRPDLAADEATVVTLCRAHHAFVTDNPEAAHAVGLHRYSWEEPT